MALPNFDDETMYSVQIARVVTIGGFTFRPMHAYTVKGKVAKLLGDAISSATPVPVS